MKPAMDKVLFKDIGAGLGVMGIFLSTLMAGILAVNEIAYAEPVTTITCGLWSVTTAEPITRVGNYRTWQDWEVVDGHRSHYTYIIYNQAGCSFETS